MDADEASRRWQLVLPHRQYLVRIAVSRGMSRDDAEDCAQEAMIRCVGFANLDEERVLAFLATTTARLAVDRHRLNARDAKIEARLGRWYVDEPSPEEDTCDRGEASWLATHISRLPDSQRTALAARAEGLSCQEIATRMGVSYKSVEALLSRARAYVRSAVATAFVLLARVRRRTEHLPDPAGAVAMAALVTVGVLLPSGATPRPVPLTPHAAPNVARAVAGAAPAPSPTAMAPGLAPAVRVAPSPGQSVGSGPSPKPGGPLPTPTLPVDPCGMPVPFMEACFPLEDYEPGQNLRNCLENGPHVSSRGFWCKPSADPTPTEE